MIKNLSVGRYLETNSMIHRLDPRTKLVGMIVFITLLMLASNWQQYVALIFYTFLMIYLTKIPISTFLKGIRPLLKIIIFTAMLQILFSSSGHTYWQWGPFSISRTGLQNAFTILVRFSLIIIVTSVVGLSTKPLDLTMGMKKLLFPLKLVGFKGHDFSLMLSIALRFIPTLFDEGQRLKKAQEARGVQFDDGGFLQRMRKFLPLFIPIFIGSFYRAGELANALDVRGYVGYRPRTTFKKMQLNRKDYLFLTKSALLLILYFAF